MKKFIFKVFKVNTIIALTSVVCFASEPVKFDLPSVPDAQLVSQEFINKVTPKSIKEDESGHEVLSQVADDVLAYWWSSTPLRQTSFVRAAESLEKKAQLSGSIKDVNQIHHVFDFKVLILQALARFEYKGWFNAGLNYNVRTNKTEAEVIKPISQNQDLILSQELNTEETHSKISLKFKW